MSLDVYLTLHGPPTQEAVIYIREDGQTRAITRAEWDARFPDREPFVAAPDETPDGNEVYWANITHNLTEMAAAANIYQALWRPEEIGIEHAAQLIPLLQSGLALLRAEPERYAAYNPTNGWGSYEGLVSFVAGYLAACERYPQATIRVSR